MRRRRGQGTNCGSGKAPFPFLPYPRETVRQARGQKRPTHEPPPYGWILLLNDWWISIHSTFTHTLSLSLSAYPRDNLPGFTIETCFLLPAPPPIPCAIVSQPTALIARRNFVRRLPKCVRSY